MRAEATLRVWAQAADLAVLTCDTTDHEAGRRYLDREQRNPRKRANVLAKTSGQMADGTYPWRVFDAFDLGMPALRVDTTRGYAPVLEAIVAFCRAGRRCCTQSAQGKGGHPGG